MLPHLLGKKGPGAAVVVGSGGGDSDGGFVEQPVVTVNAAGDVTVKGKVKPGSFGKIIVPLAVAIQAGRQYTFRTVANFAQMTMQGKLAMVGAGIKNSNDFHLFGLRGDGSTGCTVYEVYGTPPNGWNKQTGHTVADSGAPAHGTQYSTYHRLAVSADGTTVDYSTSADNVTWAEELSDVSISPFSNVSGVLTFGVALWFNNADTGIFEVVSSQFADAAAPSGPVKTLIGRFNGNVTGGGTDPQTEVVNVGAAGNKIVVVCAHSVRAAAGQRTVSSVSIDGANGTLPAAPGQIGINDGANEGTQTGIAYREISTGGNITIIVDWSGLHSCSIIEVYTMTGYVSNVHDDVRSASGNDPSLSNLNVAANGCVFAAGSGVEPSTGAFTMSGVTLDVEGQSTGSSAFMRTCSGSLTGIAATSSFAVGVSSTAGFECVEAISFH